MDNISTDNMPGCSRTRATIRCWLCTSRRRNCDGLSERVAERTGTPLADAAVVSLSPALSIMARELSQKYNLVSLCYPSTLSGL
jgi:hypothetical protein